MRATNKGCDRPNCGCDEINNCDTHYVEHKVAVEKTVKPHLRIMFAILCALAVTHFYLDWQQNLPDKKPKQYENTQRNITGRS